jgi:hypothetical protein
MSRKALELTGRIDPKISIRVCRWCVVAPRAPDAHPPALLGV